MDRRVPFLSTVVPEDAAGMRLQDFLRRRLRISRTMLRRLRVQGGILVAGEPRWGSSALAAGERVELCLVEAASPGVAPEPMPLDIRHEDEDLLALNKPAGIMVHPAHGYLTGTLANGVAHYFAAQGIIAPIRPVGRLDRETSGLVLMAKNPWLHQRLAAGHTAGTLERVYLAIAGGWLAAAQAEGSVIAPIAREPGHPLRRQVTADGAAAETRYRVLSRIGDGATVATVLELRLVTGRTHQIRVHLAHLGHPLLGDRLYGGDQTLIPRQALHARSMSFIHPRSGEQLTVTAPLPPDLLGLLAAMGEDPERFCAMHSTPPGVQ